MAEESVREGTGEGPERRWAGCAGAERVDDKREQLVIRRRAILVSEGCKIGFIYYCMSGSSTFCLTYVRTFHVSLLTPVIYASRNRCIVVPVELNSNHMQCRGLVYSDWQALVQKALRNKRCNYLLR